MKLPQTGLHSGHRYSIQDCVSYGPTFGAGWDIHITDHASSSSNSQANLGWQYSQLSGHAHGDTFTQTFLAGGSNYQFTPDEVETFYETT